ncbi:MAG TPA: hypothetical protein VK699_01765 [Terriglobales bacterium]|jgi:hypothetical protein|nr:hypothetical protein [Terriglobales bacterium]
MISPMTISNVGKQSFFDCVKQSGDYFSLQHGLQLISGGRLGNGWISSAVLGNSPSAVIDFFQSLSKGDFGGAASSGGGEAATRWGGKAAVASASNVPNVAIAAAGAASLRVETPALTASARVAFQFKTVLPTGLLARAGAEGLNLGLEAVGTVKDPIDFAVSSISALVCGITR